MINHLLLLWQSFCRSFYRLGCLLLLIMLGGSVPGFGQVQTPRSFNDPTMANIKGYYEYLPAGYVPGSGKKYPLIIFFHGVGELASSGAPLSAVTNNGVPRVIRDGKFPKTFTVNGQQFSFIVISPQFNTWPGSGDAIKFKNYLVKTYDVDVNRIYITGLSMGGGETWGALCENPTEAKAFAASAVVCGMYPPTTALAARIAANNTPIWALHNKQDPNVPSDYSVNWVKYINASVPAPNPLAKATIFDASGHDAWTKAYSPDFRENGKNMYEWMLQYSKGGTVTPPPVDTPVTPPPVDTPPPPVDTPVTPPVNPPPATGGKRIVVPMTNTANGRAEMYYPDAMRTLNVKPGDTLCIPSGEYEYLHLGNLIGTPAKPIVIINCGGQVKLGVKNQGTATVFNAPTCRFVEISGSGDPNYEYGFDLNGTNITGLKIFGLTLGEGSSDYDVHNIYIHDGNILLQAKTLQACAKPEYWEGSFVMKNVKIHHIKCRNSTGEGFYIGNTHYFWNEGECTNMRSHWIENLWVYDNDLENIGSDGLQISMTKNGDNRVFNNRLVNYAMSKNSAHGYGILIGSGSSLKVYNNIITTGYMPAITVFGSGVSEIYNNVISDIYYEGINVTDKIPENTTPDLFPPPAAIIYNNTIVNTDNGANAIKIFAYQTPLGHQVYNNLMVEKGTAYDYPSKGMYIKGDQPIKLSFGNNICYADGATAKLVDAASKNYHLLPASTAVNTGRDMSDFSLKTDYDNTVRPQQGKYDVGAFELKDGTTSPPVANGGGDITVTLPVDYVTLDGSSSTASGGSTVAGYGWKKISGPTAGTIVSADKVKTNVTGLTQGTYVFELTVTDNKGLTGTARVTVNVKGAANKPPVADAGKDVTLQLPANSTTLDGSSSTDEDGQITTWLWEKSEGPAGSNFSSAGSSKTDVGNLVKGTYVFILRITDNTGAQSSDSIKVVVLGAENSPPVAKAGKDIEIQLPVNTATLDGSSSTDEDGQITTWLWEKSEGPAGSNFSSAGSSKTDVGNLVKGTYVFILTVTDNTGAQSSDSIKVVVLGAENSPPVANAGKDIQIQLPVNTATLDGSGSTDEGGRIDDWKWEKIAGPAGGDLTVDTLIAYVNNLQEGTYTYRLTIRDNSGATSSATVNIVVLAANINQPPVANAGKNIQIQLPVNTATLDGSGSADTDGRIDDWKWEKIAGPAGGDLVVDTLIAHVSNLQEGTYTYRLTIRDNSGATSSATVNIVVLPAAANQSPIADAGNNIRIQLPANTVSLDGSASRDPDGQIAKWLWQKTGGPAGGDLSASGSAKTNAGNLQVGTYTYQLTVTDNEGATSVASINVEVLSAVNIPPQAKPGNDIQIQLPVNSATLDGSGSTDEDGNLIAWQWLKTAGPAGGDLTNASHARATVSNLVAGTYTYQLTVTDDRHVTASATMNIIVLPLAKNKPPVAVTQGDRTIQLPMDALFADGSSSYDPEDGGLQYAWVQLSGPADAGILNPDKPQTLLNKLQAGEYKFQLTVTDDQQATATATFNLKVLGLSPDIHMEDSVRIYPNPATDVIHLNVIRKGDTPMQASIYDMSGNVHQRIRYTTPDSFRAEINISNITNGQYMLEVKAEDNSFRWNGRFIKIGH